MKKLIFNILKLTISQKRIVKLKAKLQSKSLWGMYARVWELEKRIFNN
jgi:hypothetical protein